jgi:preprotein translocase subunit SecD
VTRAWTKRRLAILVAGEVLSAPVILNPIPGAHVRITMGARPPEEQLADAKELARRLMGD